MDYDVIFGQDFWHRLSVASMARLYRPDRLYFTLTHLLTLYSCVLYSLDGSGVMYVLHDGNTDCYVCVMLCMCYMMVIPIVMYVLHDGNTDCYVCVMLCMCYTVVTPIVMYVLHDGNTDCYVCVMCYVMYVLHDGKTKFDLFFFNSGLKLDGLIVKITR